MGDLAGTQPAIAQNEIRRAKANNVALSAALAFKVSAAAAVVVPDQSGQCGQRLGFGNNLEIEQQPQRPGQLSYAATE